MNEYRLTIFTHGVSPRMLPGHYVLAKDEKEAIKKMGKRFPGKTFNIQLWKLNV